MARGASTTPHRRMPHLAQDQHRPLHRRVVDHQLPLDHRTPRPARRQRLLQRCALDWAT